MSNTWPGKQESPKFGHGYGIRKENGIRDSQFSHILGTAITGAWDGILVNQEREYGKKIQRELNVTVVCWCWIVQDEKENVQTIMGLDLKYGLSTGRPGQSVAVFIEPAL